MSEEPTYKVETQGSGSAFEAWVRAYGPDAGRFGPSQVAAKQGGFSDRSAAMKWGRAKIRELRGLPPTGKPNGCRNCRYADKAYAPRGPWSCRYLVPLPEKLPWVLLEQGFDPDAVSRQASRYGIWPDSGIGCATWSEAPKP